MTVYIGCTGWDYDFWKGSFYPEDHTGSRLEFYSKITGFTELRSTFSRIPSEAKVLLWNNKSPEDFIYVAPMLRDVTYNNEMEIKSDLITDFVSAFDPLGEKLSMIMLHFPMKFQKNEGSFAFLQGLLDELSSQFSGKILVEAPNRSWQKVEVKKTLAEKSACLVGNDRRPIPSLMRDDDLYYLRLLGDRRTVPQEEFGENPLDRDDDLKYWAEHMKFLEENQDAIFVSIDNHFSGNSASDAFTLAQYLNKYNVPTKGFQQTP